MSDDTSTGNQAQSQNQNQGSAQSQTQNAAQGSTWERRTIEQVLLAHVKEQRSARRWGIFFRMSTFAVLLLAVLGLYQKERVQPVMSSHAHTALIDIYGEIDGSEKANADNVRAALRTAFQNKQVKGIVLRINSPGGSPVQARQIYNEIRAQRLEHPNIKVYAAIEDIGASAAYLIACAADEIYADQTSIVGSIGAKIESFGFVGLLEKAGVERRHYLGGQYKNALDPFSVEDPVVKAQVVAEVEATHQAFIHNVREGRGTRLQETDLLFSGLFWGGEAALKLGLIDGFADAQAIAKDKIQAKDLVNYGSDDLLDKIARRIGASIASRLSMDAGLKPQGVR